MPKYTKPEKPNLIWASAALAQNVVKPEDEKVEQGWLQEKPPLENENWNMNRLFQAYAYYNQMGVPEWDSSTEYQGGKSYVQGSDGLIYKALVTNTNQNPSGSGRDRWELAFLPYRDITAYSRQLLQSVDSTNAREVLQLGSAANYNDDRYTHRSNNLKDVFNASAAFDNIKQAATTTRSGAVELATKDETVEGTRDDRAVTPQSLGGGTNPPGTIITFAGQTAPAGYAVCDGTLLTRSEFPALFEQIGTIYGSTTSSNFRLPDLRGMFVRGWDDARGVDNNRSFGSTQSDDVRAHNHTGTTASAGIHSHTGTTANAGAHDHSATANSDGAHSHTLSVDSDGYHSHSGSANSNGAHNHSLSINNNGYHSHSGVTDYAGNHRHYLNSRQLGTGGETDIDGGNNWNADATRYTGYSGNHRHGLSINGNGSHSHTGTANTNGAHTHSLSINGNGGHSHTGTADTGGAHTHIVTVNTNGDHIHSVTVDDSGDHQHSFTTNNTGGAETRPTNIAMLYCIKL